MITTPPGVTLCCAALLVLAGCSDSDGAGRSSSSERSPSAPNSTEGSSTSTVATAKAVQACRDLLRDGWEFPAEEHPDVSWDPATGIAEFHFNDETLTLDLHKDKQCQHVPGIGPIIKRMLEEN